MTLDNTVRNFFVRLEKFETGVQRVIIAWFLGALLAATALGVIAEVL